MEAASTAINNFLSKTPAPGHRDGTTADEVAPEVGSNTASNTSSNTANSSSEAGQSGASTSQESSAATPSVDSKTIDKDTTVDQEVAPAVEHETVTREHEQQEKTVVEKERHKDHYHTTVQPLKDREVEDTEHNYEQETQNKSFDHDDNKAKADAEAQRAQFSDESKEGQTHERLTKEAESGGDHVHHHLHETIQPVIEKETVKPSITHKTINVKEKHQEASENHGVTTEAPISVDDFNKKLSGESTSFEKSYEGAPEVK